MRKHLLFISMLILGLMFALTSCDIIDPPYIEDNGNNPVDTSSVLRNVLVEEFTGHKCGNCPDASKIALKLKEDDYPGRVITTFIHAGSLAKPSPPQASSYKSDYRTPEGDELYSEFGLFGVPFGLVNRSNNGELLGEDDWASRVAQELAKEAEADIIIANSYNASSRQLTVDVDIEILGNLTDQEYVVVNLIEDNIEDWQTDYSSSPPDIEDYIHHDMFRDAINSLWGERISTSSVIDGEEFSFSYTYTIPNDFEVVNCDVIVFVHNFTTKEIRQVETAPVLP